MNCAPEKYTGYGVAVAPSSSASTTTVQRTGLAHGAWLTRV